MELKFSWSDLYKPSSLPPCFNLPLPQQTQKMTNDLHAGRFETDKLDGYFFCFKLAKKLKQQKSIH